MKHLDPLHSTEASGKLGQEVHMSRARRGVSRVRVSGTPSRTALQVVIRSHIATISRKWKTLPETTRAVWNTAAHSPEYLWVCSSGRPCSGFNFYIAAQLHRRRHGYTLWGGVPRRDQPSRFEVLSVLASPGVISLQWSNLEGLPAATEILDLYVQGPMASPRRLDLSHLRFYGYTARGLEACDLVDLTPGWYWLAIRSQHVDALQPALPYAFGPLDCR